MRAVFAWGAIAIALSVAWITFAHLLGVPSFDDGWLAGAITVACNARGLVVARRELSR